MSLSVRWSMGNRQAEREFFRASCPPGNIYTVTRTLNIQPLRKVGSVNGNGETAYVPWAFIYDGKRNPGEALSLRVGSSSAAEVAVRSMITGISISVLFMCITSFEFKRELHAFS